MIKERSFVNWKDCDGDTILHIAVAKKQIEPSDARKRKTSADPEWCKEDEEASSSQT